LLKEYEIVFTEHKHLPPTRGFDHKIPLIPWAKLVNMRPYNSSFVYKKR
jgi:hypothetical protein